jgi:hypothetical protein
MDNASNNDTMMTALVVEFHNRGAIIVPEQRRIRHVFTLHCTAWFAYTVQMFPACCQPRLSGCNWLYQQDQVLQGQRARV